MPRPRYRERRPTLIQDTFTAIIIFILVGLLGRAMYHRQKEITAENNIRKQYIKMCIETGGLYTNCNLNYYEEKRIKDEVKKGQEFLKEMEDEQR